MNCKTAGIGAVSIFLIVVIVASALYASKSNPPVSYPTSPAGIEMTITLDHLPHGSCEKYAQYPFVKHVDYFVNGASGDGVIVYSSFGDTHVGFTYQLWTHDVAYDNSSNSTHMYYGTLTFSNSTQIDIWGSPQTVTMTKNATITGLYSVENFDGYNFRFYRIFLCDS